MFLGPMIPLWMMALMDLLASMDFIDLMDFIGLMNLMDLMDFIDLVHLEGQIYRYEKRAKSMKKINMLIFSTLMFGVVLKRLNVELKQ